MANTTLLAVLDTSLTSVARKCFPAQREPIEREPLRNAGFLLRAPDVTIAELERVRPAAELAWYLGIATDSTGVLLCRSGTEFAIADAVRTADGDGGSDSRPIYPDLIDAPPVPIAPVVDVAAHAALSWLARRLAPHRYALLTLPGTSVDEEFYRELRACTEWFGAQIR